MRIGILQTGHAPADLAEAFGDYDAMFAGLLTAAADSLSLPRPEFVPWDVEGGAIPQSPSEADGWLITGSRHGVYDPLPFIDPLKDFIRAVVAAGRPLVGVCFGHQIMAEALGGRAERAPNGWIVGPQHYRFEGRALPLRLNAWHRDQVLEVPPGARVVATAPGCPVAALAYGARAFSVQAHPEFDDPFLAALIEARGRGAVPGPQLAAALARLGPGPEPAPVARRMMAVLAGRAEDQAEVAHAL